MPEPPAAGDRAPDFRLPATEGEVSLAGSLGGASRLLLAFYFEDGTPACQTAISMLRDEFGAITAAGTAVLAVSGDSVESHHAFARALGRVPFPLASDVSLDAARAYGVIADEDPKRSRRAVFVIGADERIVLAIPHWQPNNIGQVEAIFKAAGIDL